MASTWVQIEVFKSDHEGGYYAEVWLSSSGEEVHTTDVCQTHYEAFCRACEWAEKSGYEVFS